jgi:PIN domain
MYFTMSGLFRARWTADIHREWMEAVAAKAGIDIARLEKTRRLLDASVPDALVSGYEGLIPALQLPDPDDRHVLAAAIRCGASAIVTFNERDFPADELAKYGPSHQASGRLHPRRRWYRPRCCRRGREGGSAALSTHH